MNDDSDALYYLSKFVITLSKDNGDSATLVITPPARNENGSVSTADFEGIFEGVSVEIYNNGGLANVYGGRHHKVVITSAEAINANIKMVVNYKLVVWTGLRFLIERIK